MKQNLCLFFKVRHLLRIPDYSKKSRATIYRIYGKMRDYFDKESHQELTYANVAEYLDISEAELRAYFS